MNIGVTVFHDFYGKGEITTNTNENGLITVAFEKAVEVTIGGVIDTRYYFEDNREIEVTNIVEVSPKELIKFYKRGKETNYILKERNPNCHSCGKRLSSKVYNKCDICNWLKCDCSSCGCNYSPS